MPDKHIQVLRAYDESLNQATTENLNLSIQLSLDGFSFSIFNPENQKYLSIEALNFTKEKRGEEGVASLMNTIDEFSWTRRNYNSVNIYYEIPVVSLVPSSLFDEKEQASLSGFNFGIPSQHHLRNEPLQNLDAHLLFHVPDHLEESLQTKFPGSAFQSHARILVDSLLLINKNLAVQKRMYVNVRNTSIDILIIQGKQLLFYNIFSYTSKEDFIYFILFVMDQLDLSSEEISLYFCGLVDKHSALFEVAYKYVKHIEFVEPSPVFAYSHVFDDVPLHNFFNLFNSPLCES